MFTGLELSLVEFWRIDKPLHTLLEVCHACKDKVDIKCMDSVGGKTSTEPKIYLSFSNLRHIEQVNSMVCVLFNYNMGGKIRRLSMNVCQKGLNFLNNGRIVYLCIMYQSLHDYDYHLLEIRCAIFSLIG
jgi:hypothetical protein